MSRIVRYKLEPETLLDNWECHAKVFKNLPEDRNRRGHTFLPSLAAWCSCGIVRIVGGL